MEEDFRGHSGRTIRIGFGTIFSKSNREKINARSELVGSSDSTCQLCGHVIFL